MSQPLNLLDRLHVAAPCPADWNRMRGDDRVRYCDLCRFNVYNISALTPAEAEALIARHTGRLCVRLYRRADGTVLTQDCLVGRRGLRQRAAQRAGAVLAAVLSLFGGVLGQEPNRETQPARSTGDEPQSDKQWEEQHSPAQGKQRHRAPLLQGVVTDQLGGVIAQAKVKLVAQADDNEREATDNEREATTDADGKFTFERLPPGIYQIEIERGGFLPFRHDELLIQADEVVQTTTRLQAGYVEMGIFVEPEAWLIENKPTTVFDGKLPLRQPRKPLG